MASFLSAAFAIGCLVGLLMFAQLTVSGVVSILLSIMFGGICMLFWWFSPMPNRTPNEGEPMHGEEAKGLASTGYWGFRRGE